MIKSLNQWLIFKSIKPLIGILSFIVLATVCYGQKTIDSYLQAYRENGQSNIKIENELLTNINLNKLIKNIDKYYIDTLVDIRRKAYYLTFKKSTTEAEKNQDLAIRQIIKGCSDKNSSIINQNLGYLKHYKKGAFDKKSKEAIAQLLTNPKYEYFSDIYLIAGFLGIGNETIYRMYLNAETSQKLKWTLQLALARMGNKKAIESCMELVKKQIINDKVIAYLVPDLIYTRQKAAFDYCVEIINNDEKLCSSPNAESSKKTICAYRVMELIADAIVGFPYKTDAIGTLQTNNYNKALTQIRLWFKEYPNYQVDYESY